jgi:aminopeptidase N
MESPSLVWIPYGLASSRYRYLVTHETAHQWFYGLVGNDQAAHPFTDEAAADFAARYALSSRRSSTCATDELDHSIYHYSGACYYEVIYIQGGNLLESVRRQMGSTRFWAAIREYLLDNRYKLVTPATLLKALDDATSLDLSRTLRSRFPSIY